MSKIKFYKDSAKTQQVYPELDPEDITKFESLEDIENAFPNVSGEDTNITLNHTVEAPMRLELAPSELEQETNLYNGNIEQGSLDSSGNPINANDRIRTSDFIEVKPNTSINISFSGVNEYNVFSYNSSKSFITSGNWANSNTDYNINNSTYYIKIIFRKNSENITPSSISNLQVGNVPNSDYPQEIHTISGDNEIKVCGKNLLNPNEIINNYGSNASYENDGKIIKITENITTTTESSSSVYLVLGKVKDYLNKQITISGKCQSSSTNKAGFAIYTKNGTEQSSKITSTVIGVQDTTKGTINSTFTITDVNLKDDYLVLRLYAETWGILTTGKYTNYSDLQLEQNSTATPYEQHQEQSLPLNLPVENLISSSRRTGNLLYLNGSTTQADYRFKAGTYTFSYKDTNTCYLYYRTATTNAITLGTNKTTTFTINEDFNLWLYRPDMTDDEVTNIQLEKGTHANSYTPYGTTPLEYCKIGTYSDEFFKNDPSDPNYDGSLELDRWYLKKNIGKVVLDGSDENWQINAGAEKTNTCYLSCNIIDELNNGNNAISTHFINLLNLWDIDTEGFMLTTGSQRNIRIRINKTTASDIATFKTWLSENNVEVYYVLATPQYILLSDTLQHQLDDIYNWVESYPGQTNISQINNDLPFIISARAMKDLSVIDKYPTENSEHLVESGGVYEVINDVENVQDEHTAQIKALERASLIYNAIPKTTATGTDLTINDTAESPLKMSLGASELEQETTTGKNLLPKSNTTFPKTFDELTMNMNDDGSYIVTGTKTTSGYSTCYLSLPQSIIIPAGTYTVNYVTLQATGTESGIYKNLSGTFTITEPYKFKGFYWATTTAKTYNETIYPQLEIGTTKTEYEPYTGGIPAPNPEFPMDIHTISGDNTIVIQNKNLLENTMLLTPIQKNGITVTPNSDGTFTINGTNTDANTIYFNIHKEFVYPSVSINQIDNTIRTQIASEYILAATITNHSGNISFSHNSNNGLWAIGISPNASFNNAILTLQFEKGNAYSSYAPSQIQIYKLNLPVENLINKAWEQKSFNYLTGELATYDDANVIRSGAYKVKPNTDYTFSCNEELGEIAVFYYQSDGTTVIAGSHSMTSDKYWTFKTPDNAYYVYIRIGYSTNPKTATIDYKQQLEEGTKANSYTPYGTTPIELCKIGDYKDYFYKSGGKWYKHKEIGKYKFTQYTPFAQNWNRNPDYTTYCLMRIINSQLGKNAPAICNILPLVDSIYGYDKIGIYQEMNNNGRLIFRVPKTIASSIEEFQSWLVNNDMITYTPIAPIEEEITDPTLISQLEDISMAISYQTQTNIFQSNNDLPFNIEATAVLDLNTLINAIVSLGGNI